MAVASLMIDEDDDMAWAKPLVGEARADAARGDVISGEAFLKEIDDTIAGLPPR
jgi:hypothetical protein